MDAAVVAGCEVGAGEGSSEVDVLCPAVFLGCGSVVWSGSSMVALRSRRSTSEGDRPAISSLRSFSICAGDMAAMRRRFSSSMARFSSASDGGRSVGADDGCDEAARRCLKADCPTRLL